MRRKGYGDHADTGDGGTDTAASGAWVFPDAGIRISQGASGAWRAGSKVIPSSPTHQNRSRRTHWRCRAVRTGFASVAVAA
jgi:hypothetical protein